VTASQTWRLLPSKVARRSSPGRKEHCTLSEDTLLNSPNVRALASPVSDLVLTSLEYEPEGYVSVLPSCEKARGRKVSSSSGGSRQMRFPERTPNTSAPPLRPVMASSLRSGERTRTSGTPWP